MTYKNGDRVDLRDMKNGEVVRVGLGTLWAEFRTHHGALRMNAPISEFRPHQPAAVRIGPFDLHRGDPGKIVIHDFHTGEGGEFEESALAKTLTRFWNNHF